MTSRPIPIDFTAPDEGQSQSQSSNSPKTNWRKVRHAVKVASAVKDKDRLSGADTLAVSSTSSSASAAFARSLVLFTGFLFRRPSKLFRPSRVDTWAGLRQLAISSDQTLSPSFIRNLLKRKTGLIAITLTILPPLLVNTTMGFLLFTSHSFFSLSLMKLQFFQRPKENTKDGAEEEEEEINLDTLLRGPSIIPNHPTLLSGIAGAGAGLVQGAAFTPVENVVRFLHQSTTSLTSMAARFLNLPIRNVPKAFDASQPATPIQAIKNLFAGETWRKSHSWWTGWRWAVARDALSYSCFFAAFDITRRVGLRVKALFGGSIQPGWDNILILDFPSEDPSSSTSPQNTTPQPVPTIARVAQASTIVTGGVLASILAELVGRPFRACQRIMSVDAQLQLEAAKRYKAGVEPILVGGKGYGGKWEPIIRTYRQRGLRPFLQPDKPPVRLVQRQGRMTRMAKRVGWRLAAVGPWGFGFLVWAWVGGEV
ncbi:hypothetical protein I302_103648 [Kwoniella bestiolae CBS 10118]|uniref:Mitochondrial carrier protein n=1 Tax=Kwoniella bestiolae CBS 10118 TaxID=1296100 RepID=A0A1B9G945_9TREE|nr:hypothetical protein I302_02353 [Kwoniella bestiolae CBS 10118]OCF27511.1 hypothetical protein I302_02353 [Kwoniella bestiolae CBS 10118]